MAISESPHYKRSLKLQFACDTDPVQYLVEAKSGAGLSREMKPHQKLQPFTDQRARRPAFWRRVDALLKLRQSEIGDLVEAAKAAEIEKFRLKLEADEKARAFNQPHAAANFTYWAQMSYWSIDEAVALSFGRSPTAASWKAIEPLIPHRRSHENSTLSARYWCALRKWVSCSIGTARPSSLPGPNECKSTCSPASLRR